MSQFLSGLRDELMAMEEEIQTLPRELDSIVTGLDRGKLRSLFFHLNQDFDKLLDELFAPQRSRVLASPLVIMLEPPSIRQITGEDLARWRENYKSEVRVVIGKGGVNVVASSGLAKGTTLSQITLIAQEKGHTVLGWDEYQHLLDEIGRLICEDEESPPGTIVGIPVTATDSPQEVKILPKSPPFDLLSPS